MPSQAHPSTGREAYRAVCSLLLAAEVEDAAFDAEQLVRHVTGRGSFVPGPVSEAQWASLLALAEERTRRVPLQYLLGSWSFLGLDLFMGPGVLVPRPETEEVCLAAAQLLRMAAGADVGMGLETQGEVVPGSAVATLDAQIAPAAGGAQPCPGRIAPRAHLAGCAPAAGEQTGAEEAKPKTEPSLVETKPQGACHPAALDLCSGTGALALGLQSLVPAAHITAVEWYAEAFCYLQRNCTAFGAKHPRAPLAVRADALCYHTQLPPASLHLIVANPPYVTEAEYARLLPEVHHEPKQALVAGEEGLVFYKVIARQYKRALQPGGALVFEIGAAQGMAVQSILRENGYAGIEIRKDLAGHDRISVGRAPC